MIKGKVKNQPELGLRDKFTFGKYEGKTISYVIENNPSYVNWCTLNIESFKLNRNARFRLKGTLELEEESKWADLDELFGTFFF